jgi:hypothetical protein
METKEVASKLEQGSVEIVARRNGKREDGKRCIRRDLSYMDTLKVLSTFFEKRDNVFCRIDGKIANGEIGGSSQRIPLVPV